jgi:hypothetical protein
MKIYDKRKNSIALWFILFFATLIFLIPIIFFFVLVGSGKNISFGFIISCAVAVLTSGYLIRLYLWNKYGKETFIMHKYSFASYYDYKFFKDNYRTISFKSIKIYCLINGVLMDVSNMCDEATFKHLNSSIYFDLDGITIKSIGEISIADLIKISRAVNNFE